MGRLGAGGLGLCCGPGFLQHVCQSGHSLTGAASCVPLQVVSTLLAGAFVGSLAGSGLADSLGRRCAGCLKTVHHNCVTARYCCLFSEDAGAFTYSGH